MEFLTETICPLPNGLHARPASRLEELVRPFASCVTITNGRTGQTADLRSILSVISLDIRLNDPVRFTVAGPHADTAHAHLEAFIRGEFATCDEALPDVASGPVTLPPSLAMHAPQFVTGIAAVPGLAKGRLHELTGGSVLDGFTPPNEGVPAETSKLERGFNALRSALEQRSAHAQGVELALLKAHLSFLRDPELLAAMLSAISSGSLPAGSAIHSVVSQYRDRLDATGNALLKDRVLDLIDLREQLLEGIYPEAPKGCSAELTEPTILIARELTPSQFAELRENLAGLVLTQAGPTSHTVILARSFNIPVLLAEPPPSSPGAFALLDTRLGVLFPHPAEPILAHYARQSCAARLRNQRLAAGAHAEAITADGFRLEIGINVGSAAEAEAGFAAGADAIGLCRTEFLFLERGKPPTEEEQEANYRQMLLAAAGKPVIIRTLDVGGDKPLPYLQLPREENPFLGCRGIRLYRDHLPLLESQLRAILRASAVGPVKIMVPMVSHLEEFLWVRELFGRILRELAETGVPVSAHCQLGMMVETPAAAFNLEQFCPDADFFSIGTNDLAQYFFCADRGNRAVAPLCDYRRPAFLRLLASTISTAKRHHKWIGLCGDMASEPEMLPLLLGTGLDEISVAAPVIASLKRQTRRLDRSLCNQLLRTLCGEGRPPAEPLAPPLESVDPIFTSELVELNCPATRKEEVVRALVDMLYANLRTEQPDQLELEIWKREAVYSTGFGQGFAIPHCKSAAASVCSLAIARLATPVDWGALDGEPVDHVLLLAMPENAGNLHMKVFSRIARELIRAPFQKALRTAKTRPEIVEILRPLLD